MYKRPSNNQQGFTLFELMVAIAVVGLIFGIVVSQVDDWFDVNIKTATKKLGSTVRYLHDKASTENLYIRLVFDFQKNSYWVEATTEQFLLTTKEVEEAEQAEIEKEKKEEKDTTKEDENKEAPTVKKYRTPQFGAVDEFLLRPVQFPEKVFLKDVYTSHDTGPVSSGQAFIYFFPNGYIEPAMINLRDEEDVINFSIEISPIIGTTDVQEGYRELK